ncbi:tetratricopeptide repeat protein [Roseovarius sp.]|uniref:tetratricopeptide repeat protein n=1 Tax=Roseovarius sp. TaxID=1486281 RepID=UPI003A97225E
MPISNKPLLCLIVLMALAACEPGTISKGADFQRNYSVARKALEQGNYDSAIRSYAVLIQNAGPLEPRLRLEYAHALLRAGRYDEAAQIANGLAAGTTGSGRAAALAVSGTAQHESALADLSAGRTGASTLAKLRAADAALKEMLSIDAGLDPLGAMASRRADIARDLKRLGAGG